jgi:hypothetical protein
VKEPEAVEIPAHHRRAIEERIAKDEANLGTTISLAQGNRESASTLPANPASETDPPAAARR